MGKDHRGQPSGTNRNEGLGSRSELKPEQLEQDEQLTDKYTKSENEIADNVPVRHSNRNTDKDDATNAGGYKQ
jgi:hypothetical protein